MRSSVLMFGFFSAYVKPLLLLFYLLCKSETDRSSLIGKIFSTYTVLRRYLELNYSLFLSIFGVFPGLFMGCSSVFLDSSCIPGSA